MKPLAIIIAFCATALPAIAQPVCSGLSQEQCEVILRRQAVEFCGKRHATYAAARRCEDEYVRISIRFQNDLIRRQALEDAKARERDAEWVARCKPQLVTGKDGIGRYVYAHADCGAKVLGSK